VGFRIKRRYLKNIVIVSLLEKYTACFLGEAGLMQSLNDEV